MRMRELGHDLEPLEAVRETILSSVGALPTETRPLREAFGAVLRQTLVACDRVPPFDNSAMDGFAVRVADLASATEETPVRLPIQFELPAGAVASTPLAERAAIRIMTGAPLPLGVEAVVPHELTAFDRASVAFSRPVRAGQNVRRAGGDLEPGDTPLAEGATLRGPQMAIVAALGYAEVEVTRQPVVGILSPGDELVEVGEPCGPGQIRNSNAFGLDGALRDLGATPLHLGIVRDTQEAVRKAVEDGFAAGADAIVSTGGASAGDFDHVKSVVRDHGQPGHVFKVARRPGKPQVFGLFDGRPLFGLPGNPAAAILSFEIFVRPALRKMRGERKFIDEEFLVRFPFAFKYKPGRVFLLRTRVEPDDASRGGFRVAVPGEQDSSFLASLALANALVLLPPENSEVEPDELRPALWLGGRPW